MEVTNQTIAKKNGVQHTTGAGFLGSDLPPKWVSMEAKMGEYVM